MRSAERARKERKDVPITLRVSRKIYDFFEAYCKKFGSSKRGIIENKIEEKFEQIENKGKLVLFAGKIDFEEIRRKVSRKTVKEVTKGDEKFVIFVDPTLDETVARICYVTGLKMTDFYRLLLIEFYFEHRNDLTEEDLKNTRSAKIEKIRKKLGLED